MGRKQNRECRVLRVISKVQCSSMRRMKKTDHSPSPSICPKDASNPYLALLLVFPTLTQVCSSDTPVKHYVTHHIETTEPPVSAHPKRLATDHLHATKQEFEPMLQLGIMLTYTLTTSLSLVQFHNNTSRTYELYLIV